MYDSQHPLDRVAEQLEARAEQAYVNQQPSSEFLEIDNAADDSVGAYPQAVHRDDSMEFDSELQPSGFSLPTVTLENHAKLTDVISSTAEPGDGFTMNQRTLDIFTKFKLGRHAIYPVTVRQKKSLFRAEKHSYFYLHFENKIDDLIDFENSTFYVEDTLGEFVADISVSSLEQFMEINRAITDEEHPQFEFGSSVSKKMLILLNNRKPESDLFSFERISITKFVKSSLGNELTNAGISGLKLSPSKRL